MIVDIDCCYWCWWWLLYLLFDCCLLLLMDCWLTECYCYWLLLLFMYYCYVCLLIVVDVCCLTNIYCVMYCRCFATPHNIPHNIFEKINTGRNNDCFSSVMPFVVHLRPFIALSMLTYVITPHPGTCIVHSILWYFGDLLIN